MTVEVYNPDQLTLSDRALTHIHQQLEKHAAVGLILGIKETGCNGYMYDLGYLTESPDNTQLRRFDFEQSVSVYVAEQDLPFLQGIHVDFVTEGLNSTLTFNNPNVDTLCGCGESFSTSGT